MTPDARRLAPAGALLLVALSAARTAAAQTRPPTLMLTASPSGFSAPASAPAGTLIIALNNRSGRVVSAQLMAVLEGHTAQQAIAALTSSGRRPDWVVAAGGIGPLAAARTAAIEQRLPAGEFVLASTVADTDGVPQFRRGYIAGFHTTGAVTVNEREAYAAATATLTIGASFRFQRVAFQDGRRIEMFGGVRGSPMAPGEDVIEVTPSGIYSHEIMVVKMDEGTLLRRYVDWFEGGRQGTPLGVPVGGAGVLPPGRTAWLRIPLEPGTYRVLCTLLHREGARGYQTGEYSEFLVR